MGGQPLLLLLLLYDNYIIHCSKEYYITHQQPMMSSKTVYPIN